MKRSLPNTILILQSFLPALAMVLCSFGQPGNTGGLPIASGAEQPSGDSIIIFKNNLSRAHKVALYTDALQTAVFFNVRGHQGNVYHLYVFDMDGRLIKHTEARSEQTTYIKKMEKGVYLFEVFNNDDKIGNGQIAVM